ncbi:MAG: M24 family metallopeptidase, partial [Miltoncostaeaceae bacterium]
MATDLMDATRRSLAAGITQARVGNRTGDIGAAVQEVVERAGFNVVRTLVGHGVGRSMHEEPQVYNYGARGRGLE